MWNIIGHGETWLVSRVKDAQAASSGFGSWMRAAACSGFIIYLQLQLSPLDARLSVLLELASERWESPVKSLSLPPEVQAACSQSDRNRYRSLSLSEALRTLSACLLISLFS